MRAVVLDAPGPPEALRVRDLPIPAPRHGWVLIEVEPSTSELCRLSSTAGISRSMSCDSREGLVWMCSGVSTLTVAAT